MEELKKLGFEVRGFTKQGLLTSTLSLRKKDFHNGWEIELFVINSIANLYPHISNNGHHILYKVTGKDKEIIIKVPATIEDSVFNELVRKEIDLSNAVYSKQL